MKYKLPLTSLSLLLLSTACSTPVEPMDSDYTMFLPMNPVTANYYKDLNEHQGSLLLEETTGLVIDYYSPFIGEESLTFLLQTVSQDVGDMMRMDLSREYLGGVDYAILDGFIHDVTPYLEEYAPNFMARIAEDDSYALSAYTDTGKISKFGATITDEELRGLPSIGPMVNLSYLEEAGLDIPVTIADWEEMLSAFHDMGITPFSFGGTDGYAMLYDCFASAYGVTMGNFYFQQDGVVKFSPFEEGFYQYLSLLHSWYEKGWLETGYFAKSHSEDTLPDFSKGKVGASVLHISTLATASTASPDMTFAPVPYPVLQEGDTTHTREYTLDYYDAPIYINAKVDDPIPLIQWIDFFYSEEGIALSNWGEEGVTYELGDNGEKVFTDLIYSGDMPSTSLHSKEVFLESSTVLDYDCQSAFFQEGLHDLAWDTWGQGDYDWHMPQNYSYTIEENEVVSFDMDTMNSYINQMVSFFIIGQEPLSQYDAFVQELRNMGAEKYLAIEQSAVDRYYARGK